MQFIIDMQGVALAVEGQNVVRTLQGEPRPGVAYTRTIRPNIADEGETPKFRHLNVTLASEGGILPSYADFGDYTITVTVDIVENELVE